jgi:hypothetical protein
MSRPIEELWSGSCTALQEIEIPAGISLGDPYRDISNVFIITALVLFLLFANRRIIIGLTNVLQGLFNHKKLMGIEAQSNIQICRNTLFMFLTLCTSFLLANIAYATKTIGYESTLPIRFAGILGTFVIYFFIKRLSLNFLAWLNKKPAIKLVQKISYTYACIWYILVLCCFIAIKSISSAPMGNMRYCMVFSLLPVMLMYFFSIFRIFLQKGFSHFFYILYLCTLEILPIAMLLYLNFS